MRSRKIRLRRASSLDKVCLRAYGEHMSDMPTVRFLDRSTPPHIFTLVVMAGLSALVMNIFLPSLPSMTTYFDTEYRIVQLSVAV